MSWSTKSSKLESGHLVAPYRKSLSKGGSQIIRRTLTPNDFFQIRPNFMETRTWTFSNFHQKSLAIILGLLSFDRCIDDIGRLSDGMIRNDDIVTLSSWGGHFTFLLLWSTTASAAVVDAGVGISLKVFVEVVLIKSQNVEISRNGLNVPFNCNGRFVTNGVTTQDWPTAFVDGSRKCPVAGTPSGGSVVWVRRWALIRYEIRPQGARWRWRAGKAAKVIATAASPGCFEANRTIVRTPRAIFWQRNNR